MSKKKIRIGLTGGIGSGKTFISAIFTKLGIPVFNADVQAKKCMESDPILNQRIQNIFGDEVYKNGIIQKEILAKIIFNNNQKLEELNQLVHPFVKKNFNYWCDDQSSNIIIKEAAILFESGSHLALDKVICVLSPIETRIKRVIDRDNISREQVLARVDSQMSQDEKEKLSDFIIINDGVDLLLPQIIKIITQIS